MKVSVIVRCKNNKDTIADCIFGLLSQSLLPYEIIVVDDSMDGTDIIADNILRSSGINYKIIKQDKSGIGYATHLGIIYATGDVIITTDGDTILSENVIKNAVECLKDENITVVGAKSYPIKPGLLASLFTPFTEEKITGSPVGRFLAFRKSDYALLDGLVVDGIYRGYYEDYILVSRLKKKGRSVLLDNPVFTEIPTTTQKIVAGQMISLGMIVGGILDAFYKRRYIIDIPLIVSGTIFLYIVYRKRGILNIEKLSRYI